MAFTAPSLAFPGGKPPSVGSPPGGSPGSAPTTGNPPAVSKPPGGGASNPPGGAAPGGAAPGGAIRWEPPPTSPQPPPLVLRPPAGAGAGGGLLGGAIAGGAAGVLLDLAFPGAANAPTAPSSNVPQYFNPGGNEGSPEGYQLFPPSAPYSFNIHATFTRNVYQNDGDYYTSADQRVVLRTEAGASNSYSAFGVPVAITFKRVDLGLSTFGGMDGKKFTYMRYEHQIDLIWKTGGGETRKQNLYTGDAQGFTHFNSDYQYFDNGQPITFAPPAPSIPDQFPGGYTEFAPPVLAPPFADPEIQKLPSPQRQPSPPPTRRSPPPFAPAPVFNPAAPPAPSPSPAPQREPSPPPLRLPTAPGQPAIPGKVNPLPPALPQTPRLPQPQPSVPPPKPPTTTGTDTAAPPKPPTPEICQDPCIADVQNKLKDLKDKLEPSDDSEPPNSRISIKIFRECKLNPTGDDLADFDLISIDVPSSEAENIKELHDRIFQLQSEQCKEDKTCCVAAVPEWWQVRLGADRPQLIVQYAEVLSDGKFGAPMYPLTIPHYSNSADDTIADLFPSYQKGQYMGVLTLVDNSKLIVNCNTQAIAESIIDVVSLTIDTDMLEGAHISIGKRKGQGLKTITVAPRIAKFFPNGQKNMKPQWIKYFYD